MLQHAILAVSGISCANIQCLYTWEGEGWVAVWQVKLIEPTGGHPRWQLEVVTAGEEKQCPSCGAKQRLPKIYDRTEAIVEISSFNHPGKETPQGYFCLIDCSKGKLVKFS